MGNRKSGIKFGVYNTPAANGGKSKPYPRVITTGTKRIDDICEYINQCSTLSPADIKGVLEALTGYIGRELSYGYSVELEGLGHFTASLRSSEKVNEKGQVVYSAYTHGVNFRCSNRLKELVKKEPLIKTKRANIPQQSLEGRKTKMMKYLDTQPYINLSDYSALNTCTYYCAAKDIKQFMEEGVIQSMGYRTHKVYVRSSGANMENIP